MHLHESAPVLGRGWLRGVRQPDWGSRLRAGVGRETWTFLAGVHVYLRAFAVIPASASIPGDRILLESTVAMVRPAVVRVKWATPLSTMRPAKTIVAARISPTRYDDISSSWHQPTLHSPGSPLTFQWLPGKKQQCAPRRCA